MAGVLSRGLADFKDGGAERVRLHAAQFTWERAASAYLALYQRFLPG